MGTLGYKFTDEQRRRVSLGLSGKKRVMTPKRRAHLDKIHAAGFNKGKHWKVKDVSNLIGRPQGFKKGITIAAGKDHPMWRGGITKINKLIRRLPKYLQWRSDVFTRDNWTCKTCGMNGVFVTAHHINGFSKIIKENSIKTTKEALICDELWDINNGVTLCGWCHSLTHNYKGRANSKSVC